ncbi:MAG: hypothetical protein LBQ66_10730 [Planctomycetaceae bacterium]|nr:hypothetical protein [Planctomycetaceae bacterium]
MSELVFVVMIFLLTLPSFLLAEAMPEDEPLPDLKNIVVSGPYCGIYSLCACLEAFDKPYQLQELLIPEYVGSFRGSSAGELIECAKKYDIYGRSYGNMAWHHLSSISEPAIIHFRGNSDSDFNHWVAFLGIEGDRVRIIDAPHKMAYLTKAELLAQWDGIAIVLSKNPVQGRLIWLARLEFLFVALLVISGGLLYKTFYWSQAKEPSGASTNREFYKCLVVQTVVLSVFCGIVAVAYHVLSPIGFLCNPSAVAEVTRRYYAVDVPEISLDEMKIIAERKSDVIYDARYYRDFERGSIPNAISFPINSNLAERKQILRGIDKSQKIVLYCQSSGCGFSDDVASFLKFNGYNNIVIFRGGYREWEKSQKQQPQAKQQ